MRRRTFVRSVGAGTALAAAAGCLRRDGGGNGSDGGGGQYEGTLTVATYDAFVESPSTAPGPWLKEAFEERNPDATVEWDVREQGLNYYVQRADQGVDVEADLYVGLNVDDLVLVDDALDQDGSGTPALFSPLDRERLDHADRVREDLEFGDPKERVVPYDTGYISLVYDENEVDEPATFDALLDPAYEGALLAQNAQQSDPGQAFLLWTIDAYGEEGYLDYWRGLVDNDVRILGSWWDAYSAYLEEERPIVVSYSTDQVFAVEDDLDLSRHQIGFPNDQGYANPEGMAIFADSEETDLAYGFLDFLLSSEAQARLATLNVQFPAVEAEYVDLDESFDQYAFEPPETVAFGYDQLRGTLGGWVDDWAREMAGR